MAEQGEHKILSLDMGMTLGWCRVADSVITSSGTLSLSRKDSHPGDRFVRFSNFLQSHKDVKEVFYEDVPRFESAKYARVWCGFLSILQMWCLVNGKRMTCIKPNTVKKAFTGHGGAEKEVMCRTAHRLGWKHGHPDTDIDHDECDAIAVAWVILDKRGYQPSLAV